MSQKISFKVVVLGAVSVGKTCLSVVYVEDEFPEDARATIAAAFCTKSLQIKGKRVDLQIWDTAGQEKFRSLTPMYYRDCAAALCVYDLSKPETLDTAKYWVSEVKSKESPYIMILVGNKSDLVKDLAGAAADGREFAEQNDIPYFTCSAKQSDGVSEIFSKLVAALPVEDKPAPSDTVPVRGSTPGASGGGSDCNC